MTQMVLVLNVYVTRGVQKLSLNSESRKKEEKKERNPGFMYRRFPPGLFSREKVTLYLKNKYVQLDEMMNLNKGYFEKPQSMCLSGPLRGYTSEIRTGL